jgi:hypothetical protein
MTNKQSMGWEKNRYARGTHLFVLLRRTAVGPHPSFGVPRSGGLLPPF